MWSRLTRFQGLTDTGEIINLGRGCGWGTGEVRRRDIQIHMNTLNKCLKISKNNEKYFKIIR